MQHLLNHAQGALGPYKDPSTGIPDPSFTLQLPDEVYSGSNLYAVQKIFDGEFQFDVFFESSSAKQKISCTYHTHPVLASSLNPCLQLPLWTMASPICAKASQNATTRGSPFQQDFLHQ